MFAYSARRLTDDDVEVLDVKCLAPSPSIVGATVHSHPCGRPQVSAQPTHTMPIGVAPSTKTRAPSASVQAKAGEEGRIREREMLILLIREEPKKDLSDLRYATLPRAAHPRADARTRGKPAVSLEPPEVTDALLCSSD